MNEGKTLDLDHQRVLSIVVVTELATLMIYIQNVTSIDWVLPIFSQHRQQPNFLKIVICSQNTHPDVNVTLTLRTVPYLIIFPHYFKNYAKRNTFSFKEYIFPLRTIFTCI